MGFGKKLIRIAETVAWNNNYHYAAIISAVGTREYYKKVWLSINRNLYGKKLTNPHIWVDIIFTALMFLACSIVIYTLY